MEKLKFFTRLYSTALDWTRLHSTSLHFTRLHSTALGCTRLHLTVLDCTRLHSTVLDCTRLHSTAISKSRLHFKTLDCTSKPSSALRKSRLHFTALNYTFFLWTDSNSLFWLNWVICLFCNLLFLTVRVVNPSFLPKSFLSPTQLVPYSFRTEALEPHPPPPSLGSVWREWGHQLGR